MMGETTEAKASYNLLELNPFFTNKNEALSNNLASTLALIKGEHPTNFGTAFHILKDKGFSYFITSAQVIEDLGNKQDIRINDLQAEIVALGNKKGFDLAILKIKDHTNDLPIFNLIYPQQTITSFISAFYKYDDRFFIESITGEIEEQKPLYDEKCRTTVPAWQIKVTNNKNLFIGCNGAPIFTQEDNLVFGIIIQKYTNPDRGLVISVEALKHIWPNIPEGLISDPSTHKQIIIFLSILKELSQAVEQIDRDKEKEVANLNYQIETKKLTFEQAKRAFIELYKKNLNICNRKQDTLKTDFNNLHSSLNDLKNLASENIYKLLSEITITSKNIIHTEFNKIEEQIISITNNADFSLWLIRSQYDKENLMTNINVEIEKLLLESLSTISNEINRVISLKLSYFEDNLLKDLFNKLKIKNIFLTEMELAYFEKELYVNLKDVITDQQNQQIMQSLQSEIYTVFISNETFFHSIVTLSLPFFLKGLFRIPIYLSRKQTLKIQTREIYLEKVQKLSENLNSYLQSTHLRRVEERLYALVQDISLATETQVTHLIQYQHKAFNTQKETLNLIKNKFDSVFNDTGISVQTPIR